MNQNSIAEEILGILIIGARESKSDERKAELQEWLAAVKENRQPELSSLRRTMERLF